MFTTVATITLLFLFCIWKKSSLLNFCFKFLFLLLSIWGLVESFLFWGFIFQPFN
jgi:hypothetical protein